MRKTNKFDLILDAASEVFLSNGFEKARIQEIAEKAGVGKGTVYEYFQSKEELFVETIKKGVSYVYKDLYATFDNVETMEELIDTYLQQALYLIDEHSDKLTILFDDFPKTAAFSESHSWFLEKSDLLIAKLTEKIQQFINKQEIRNVNPEILAIMILDTLRTGFHYKIIKQTKNIRPILEAQINIFQNGINT